MTARLFRIPLQLCFCRNTLLSPTTCLEPPKRLIRLSVDDLPLITVPIRLQERIKKIRQKIEAAKRIPRPTKRERGVAVITCNNHTLNHYKGQVYNRLELTNLASRNWFSRKSVGDFMTIAAFDENPAVKVKENDRKTFDGFGLRKELVEKLELLNINFPTNIQALSIPSLLKGGNAICAAETGSGKTLAYLLPILNSILEYKDVIPTCNSYCSPSVLILVPSRELALQIKSVINKLTESLPIKSKVLVGGLGTKRLMLHPRLEETDIVVSSLGVIKKLVSSDLYSISKLRHVVIDEADTMLDDSFNVDLVAFLKKISFRDAVPYDAMDPNLGVQLCLVGATLPRSLDTILHQVVPTETLIKITTSHLHRLMPHVPQTFLRMKKSEKSAKLMELVKADLRKKHNVLVFSKDASTCDYVKMFLEENGVECINFNGEMHAQLRNGRFHQFQNGTFHVMSCTDLASRGLDTIMVQHVINYDFPTFMSDYIHRAGRVGRVGSIGAGHVTNFICAGYEVDLVQKIEMATRKTESFPNVNANIKRKLLSNILGDDYM